MRSFFYARVSSKDQSEARQTAVAKELGIEDEYVFIEKASGKDFKRPEYQLMKRMLRAGDLLYITSLDRLGRNKQMILDEWQELTIKKQVDIAVLDMPLLNTAKYKEIPRDAQRADKKKIAGKRRKERPLMGKKCVNFPEGGLSLYDIHPLY